MRTSAFSSSAFPSHIDTHSCIFSFHEYLLLQVLTPVHTPLAPVKSPGDIFTSHVKWMNSEKVSCLVSGVRLHSHLDLYFISTAACKIRPRYGVVVITITPLHLGYVHTVQWDFRTFILEGTNGHFQPESELLCVWPGCGACVCVFFFSSTCLSPVNKTSGECGGKNNKTKLVVDMLKSHEICHPRLHVYRCDVLRSTSNF